MALPTPPSITNPIPNNTFYSDPTWNLVAPQGPLIVGQGLEVVPGEGTVIAVPQAVGVNSILAGNGISVDQPDGDVTVTNTGVTNLQAGPNIQVSANSGTVVVEAVLPFSIIDIIGTLPVRVSGSAVKTISVDPASITASGIVQLYNDVNLDSEALAVTASVAKYLQDQISALVLSSSNLLFAGTINANTGLLTAVTPEGTNEGFTVGSALPAPALTNTGYFVIVTVAGSFTPPGGASPVTATKGDWLVSSGTTWDFLDVGFDAQAASTTQAGIVKLATDQETQDGITGTVAATPLGIQSKLSDSTSLTSSTTIASSTAVKEAYDLADEAIPKSFLTTKGAILATDTPGQPFSVVPVQDGYYLQSDLTSPGGVKWTTTGTVCTVSTGPGLTGGPITQTGTISLAPSGITPAVYPYPTNLNIDGYGRIVGADFGSTPVTTDDYTALGTIVAGTGANTFGTLTPGSGSQILSVDYNCPTGLKWINNCVGTVTSLTTGTGLTGGTITTSGTVALSDTTVTPGSYPNACICVDQQGRITDVKAGGVGITCVGTGPGLIGGPITSTGTLDLSNTGVSADTYTNATVTVDAKGRITSAENGCAPILCSELTTTGDIIVASAPSTPTALPVGVDGYVLTTNSNCALGVEWAAPASGPSQLWVESFTSASNLVTSVCDALGCSGGPYAPTFTTVSTDVACYRQLGSKLWEVGWFIKKTAAGGTDKGTGQYLWRLPPEVPDIDTSISFQATTQDFCALNSSGSACTLDYVAIMPTAGTVRYGNATALTILPSVWADRCIRIAGDDTDDPGFLSSDFYAASGTTSIYYMFSVTYQSV